MSVDLEKILRPIDHEMAPYEPKYMLLASGEAVVVRQVFRDEIPDLLKHVEPLIHVERDFYDVVAARVYAELLGYYRYRFQDQYVLALQVDGELAAIVNGRQINPKLGLSLHTLAFRRGLRIGAHGFAAKMEYHIDTLGHDEVLVVAESPIGFRRWMLEYELEKRFDIPHELGGVPSWALTRDLFNRARSKLVVGRRPVPPDILAKAMEKILPPSDPPTPPVDPLAATRSMHDPTGTALIQQRWEMEKGLENA